MMQVSDTTGSPYPSDEEVEQIMKEIDLDGNGTLEFDEFLYKLVGVMSLECLVLTFHISFFRDSYCYLVVLYH